MSVKPVAPSSYWMLTKLPSTVLGSGTSRWTSHDPWPQVEDTQAITQLPTESSGRCQREANGHVVQRKERSEAVTRDLKDKKLTMLTKGRSGSHRWSSLDKGSSNEAKAGIVDSCPRNESLIQHTEVCAYSIVHVWCKHILISLCNWQLMDIPILLTYAP